MVFYQNGVCLSNALTYLDLPAIRSTTHEAKVGALAMTQKYISKCYLIVDGI